MKNDNEFWTLICPECKAEMYRGYIPNYRDNNGNERFRVDYKKRMIYVQCKECKKEIAFPLCPYCFDDREILLFCGYWSGCVMPQLISDYCHSVSYDTDKRCDQVTDEQTKTFIQTFYKDKLVLGYRDKKYKFQYRIPTAEELQ